MMRLWNSFLCIYLATACAASAGAQSAQQDASASDVRGPLSTGIYFGYLYENFYLKPLFAPQTLKFLPDFLVAANFDYRFYQWATVPLQFEGEFDVTRRWGAADEVEVVVAPFVRWTAFPWNEYLYTNARASIFGLSYVSGISPWERENSGNDRGSKFLQFGAFEFTFAPHENSRGEAFIRVHHRSGLYGLINGVSGASNYLSVGFRVFW
jgi:hypothetical protein